EVQPQAPRPGRGSLRRARHRLIQRRARRATCQGHAELSRRAWYPDVTHHGHLVRRGAAAVLRALRVVLGEESPRAFHGEGAVVRAATRGVLPSPFSTLMGGPRMGPPVSPR